MKNVDGFTLVELIVVVTILTILGTIGFVSYSGHLTGVRDANRIASLNSISDGLSLALTKGKLPYPNNAIDIIVDGENIAKQGYAGEAVLETIDYSKPGLDPRDKQYYSYYLSNNRKHFQLISFLEESHNLVFENIIGQTYAASDYSSRTPYVSGKKLGILTDTNNTPIQELISLSVDIGSGNTDIYKAYLTSTQSLTGSDLSSLATAVSNGGKFCRIGLNKVICSSTIVYKWQEKIAPAGSSHLGGSLGYIAGNHGWVGSYSPDECNEQRLGWQYGIGTGHCPTFNGSDGCAYDIGNIDDTQRVVKRDSDGVYLTGTSNNKHVFYLYTCVGE